MPKFKVVINWYGENRVFYTHAKSKPRAVENAINQLSLELKISRCSCRQKVLSGKDCFNVKEIAK